MPEDGQGDGPRMEGDRNHVQKAGRELHLRKDEETDGVNRKQLKAFCAHLYRLRICIYKASESQRAKRPRNLQSRDGQIYLSTPQETTFSSVSFLLFQFPEFRLQG